MAAMAAARAAHTPGRGLRRTAPASLLIHGAVVLGLLALAVRAFWADDLFAWSLGIAYLIYDAASLGFLVWQTRHILRSPPIRAAGDSPSLAVVIAARNEAAVLAACIATLAAQTPPPDEILVADDGSSDATPDVMQRHFGLATPPLGEAGPPSPVLPTLRWLRLPHGGKAAALNAAIAEARSDLVMTVDADTLVEAGGIAAFRAAFAADPRLVAASGVLLPVADASFSGRLLQGFQSQEYLRQFLTRYAWGRLGCVTIVAGAFGCYRRSATMAVGGFDPASIVEDYEIVHRLHRHGGLNRLGWRTDIVGGAVAHTDAPSRLLPFLRQRRRWFGGFLQTQLLYRDMAGDPSFGLLGMAMLPVKAIDAVQPIAVLLSALIAVLLALGGHWAVLRDVAALVGLKMALDMLCLLWGQLVFRRWTGRRAVGHLPAALICAALDCVSYLLLRNLGSASGWAVLFSRPTRWGPQSRSGVLQRMRRSAQ
jgi:cellulose synthase/poly-beta-1,6-N-acetylglucosamine synthase-like glycosyltransferase